MDVEKLNPNFDINAKYEDIINVSKRIIEHHEFVSDGSCEPPSYICLAYDIKNYLPKLQQENQELKKQIEEINNFISKAGFVNIQQLMLNYCAKVEQQKEFIEWLEKEIKETDKTIEMLCDTNSCRIPYVQSKKWLLKETLKKYKEIVGGNNDQ